MTARSGKFLPVGMRYAAIFALDANGRPAAPTKAPYVGERWSGPLAFDINSPAPRTIVHKGADRVLRTSTLPTQEATTGTLRVSDFRFDILAIMTGIPVGSVGEAKEVAHVTSKQGYEPYVGLMLYQQAQDLDTGKTVWHSYIIPKTRCLSNAGSMNDAAGELSFAITPQIVNQRLWGQTLTLADDGYTEAAFFEYDSEGMPAVATFLADGAEDLFEFPTGEEALSADKIAVFIDGVLTTTGFVATTAGIDFTTAPTDGTVISVWYELNASAVDESV